jgi:hypothetical protein
MNTMQSREEMGRKQRMGGCLGAYVEHVGDGLESSVWMVGEPGGLGH